MGKKRLKTNRFSIMDFDMAHYRTTDSYTKAVDKLFAIATNEITNAASKADFDPDKPFSFDDYPKVKAQMQKTVASLTSKVQSVIETGSRKQWLFSCKKNDAFIKSIFDTSKLKKSELKQMTDKCLDALYAFQARKVAGMNLSQRVWKYTDQFREQIEHALDVGLGEGRSAQELSRDVRQNLNDPNRLFRRVRDKRGNLVLSKAAKAFHPGRGVYRSSYKNAMRLTRSEINMAYRESDYQRWQNLDFVVGFEIKRSNHEPLCKCSTCEKLVGRYPKTFKFVGWHPQCMCFAIPIIEDYFSEGRKNDRVNRLKAALKGTEAKKYISPETIDKMPEGFNNWVDAHVEAQKNWSSTPYFIKDNFLHGSLKEGLKIKLPIKTPVEKVDTHVPFEKLAVEERINFNNEMANRANDDYDLVSTCKLYGIDSSWYDKMADEVADNNQYWRISELNAARERLKSQLMAKIEQCRILAKNAISQYESAANAAGEWIGSLEDTIKYARETFSDEAKEKYPNYQAILNSANGGVLDVTKLRARVDDAKTEYNQAIADAKACVTKCDGKIDVESLKSLMNETRTALRNAKVITKEINDEIKKSEQRLNDFQSGFCSQNIDELKTTNIEYREVKKHKQEQTFEEIVSRVGGGDRTKGSCASVGLAYAANRGGYDVLDFRDGDSRNYFASHKNLRQFVNKLGGLSATNATNMEMSGVELMRTTEIGKEYYLAIDCHAAIVRQVSKGKYEYLELQSATCNGWHHLDAKVFGWRFGARGRTKFYELIEISKLYNDPSFIKMMGYINTAVDKQAKGMSGSIK